MLRMRRQAGCLESGTAGSADFEYYGYEVIAREAVPAMTKLLVEFLQTYAAVSP